MPFTQGGSTKWHINDTNNKCQIRKYFPLPASSIFLIMLIHLNPKGPWAKKITIGYRLHDSLPSKSNHNNGKQALRGIEDNDLVCKNNSKQLKFKKASCQIQLPFLNALKTVLL